MDLSGVNVYVYRRKATEVLGDWLIAKKAARPPGINHPGGNQGGA